MTTLVADDMPQYEAALRAIDDAHSQDPRKVEVDGGQVPYELHYARRMSGFLDRLRPDASPTLCLAIRAQHFRRWEVPRGSYAMNRQGYHSWRTALKQRQAEQATTVATTGSRRNESASSFARRRCEATARRRRSRTWHASSSWTTNSTNSSGPSRRRRCSRSCARPGLRFPMPAMSWPCSSPCRTGPESWSPRRSRPIDLLAPNSNLQKSCFPSSRSSQHLGGQAVSIASSTKLHY